MLLKVNTVVECLKIHDHGNWASLLCLEVKGHMAGTHDYSGTSHICITDSPRYGPRLRSLSTLGSYFVQLATCALGKHVLSVVRRWRLSRSQRLKIRNVLFLRQNQPGARLSVLCIEVVPISECPLWEVPLLHAYKYRSECMVTRISDMAMWPN